MVCTSTNNATTVDWYVWSDATDEVADITINNQASSQCRMFIGIDGNTGHPAAPFGSIDTLTRNSGSGPVLLMDVRTSTTGSHTGNVDRIKVHSINAGNIAGSVSTLFVVESNTGIGENSIESLRVRGNIECDISMPRGSIYGLTVDGSIGLAGSHVAVDVSHHITSLQAGSIYADITTNTVAGTLIGTVKTTSGDFSGSLTGRVMTASTSPPATQQFIIARDLDADITLSNKIDQLSSPPQFQVGRDFTSGHTISVANSIGNIILSIGRNCAGNIDVLDLDAAAGHGLKGQFIVNANNSGGTWTGSASVDGVAFAGIPYYSNTNSMLLNGAVGVVPFNVHKFDSFPAYFDGGGGVLIPGSMLQTELAPTSGVTQKSVVVSLYGPVRTGSTSTAVSPVRVWHMLSDSVGVEVTDNFTVTCQRGTGTLSSPGWRTLTVTGKSGIHVMPGLYRVTPVLTDDLANNRSKLYCDQVSGNPAVYDFDFRFRVLRDCDANGFDDAADIAGNSSLDTFPDGGDGFIDDCEPITVCPAEFNGDGFLNGDDLDAFADAFVESSYAADIDGDGFVNAEDYDWFVWWFEQGCVE
ncbi:MAG: hypothetical protein K1X57_23045 [Gemmataceae bacterium]|nr:hypothetical protein [Gemmataceae bacterium]